MSLTHRVATNTTYQIAGRLVSSAFAFVSTALIARALGTDRFGLYVTAGVFAAFFETFLDFGLTQVLVRECAQAPGRVNEILSKAMTLKLVLGVVVFLLASVCGELAFRTPGKEVLRLGALIVAASFLVTWWAGTYMAYFIYAVRHQAPALATIAAKAAALVAILFMVRAHSGLLALLSVNVLASVVSALVLYVAARREPVRLRWMVDLPRWRAWLLQAAPMGCVILLNVVYLKADAMLIAAMRPPAEVGTYGLAYNVVDFAMAPAGFLMLTLYPMLAAGAGDPGRLSDLLGRALRVLLVGGVGVFVVTELAAGHLLFLLGGASHLSGVPVLRVLLFAVLISYLNAALGHTIIAIGRSALLFRNSILVLVLNLVVNVIAIPRVGILGAALAMVLCELVSFLLLLVAVRGQGIGIRVPGLPRVLLFGALTLAVFAPWYPRTLGAAIPGTLLSLVWGAASILGCYALLLGVTRTFHLGRELRL